jgi:hypothetical protein
MFNLYRGERAPFLKRGQEQKMVDIAHSIGFRGGQLSSYVEYSSALDFPWIPDARSQDQS